MSQKTLSIVPLTPNQFKAGKIEPMQLVADKLKTNDPINALKRSEITPDSIVIQKSEEYPAIELQNTLVPGDLGELKVLNPTKKTVNKHFGIYLDKNKMAVTHTSQT